MDNENVPLVVGFILGIAATAFLWFICAGIVENTKVTNGYLTYENTVYKVEVFDTLDKPERD